MRERKRSVCQRTARRKKVSGKSCQLHFPLQIYCNATPRTTQRKYSRISAPALCIEYPARGLSRQIRCSLTHNIPKSQLATQAAEFTTRDVKSGPSRPSYTIRMHGAAVSDTVEVLLPQSGLDAHDAMQTDLTGHEAEEASWSVLCVDSELTRQAEHTCHLDEGCACND